MLVPNKTVYALLNLYYFKYVFKTFIKSACMGVDFVVILTAYFNYASRF